MKSMDSANRKTFGNTRWAGLCAVCLAVLLGTAPVFAQDSSGPPPPPDGQGRGMGRMGPGGPGRMLERQLEMMTKQLSLTPDQVTQVKAIQADADKQMLALRDDTSTSRDDKRPKMMAIRQDSQTKIAAVLTPDQKSKWEAMQAKMRERREERQGANGDVPPPPPPPQ